MIAVLSLDSIIGRGVMWSDARSAAVNLSVVVAVTNNGRRFNMIRDLLFAMAALERK